MTRTSTSTEIVATSSVGSNTNALEYEKSTNSVILSTRHVHVLGSHLCDELVLPPIPIFKSYEFGITERNLGISGLSR